MTNAATLGIAAGVALGVWLAVLAVLAVATRAREPHAAPATMELGGDESPAVVNLITNDWAVGKAAVPATLIDLAARKVVAFERVGPERFVVRIPARRPPELTPYEAQVYDHVSGLASGGVVPCEALTTGPENESKKWWSRFRGAVSTDARDRGLSRPRWARGHLVVLGVLAVAPAGLASGAFAALPATSSSSKSDDGGPLGYLFLAVILWMALMTIPRSLRAERETAEGMVVASRWLGLRAQLAGDSNFATQPPAAIAIWDRLLSYGAAMGVAPGAVRVLPMGAESETQAWTAYGGRWRVVHVRYPKAVPPGWGRKPLAAVARGLGLLLASAFVVYALRDLAGDSLPVVRAVLLVPAAIGIYGISLLYSGGADLGRRRTLDGQVLRRKEVISHNDSGSSTVAVYLAVYDGNGADVRALRCEPQVASGFGAGDVVRATITPHLRHVYTLERRAPMVSIQTGS
jgi:Predicted membrane protein (DUF2207)